MVNMAAEESLFRGIEAEAEEDEISVGCPSPAARRHRDDGSTDGEVNDNSDAPSSSDSDVNDSRPQQDDYFKPLKRLKMMQIEQVSYSIAGKKVKRIRQPRRQSLPEDDAAGGGVKSFSILDILNHRPAATTATKEARIVRPWDSGSGLEVSSPPPPPPLLPPPAHRGLLPPPPLLYRLPFNVGLPPGSALHNAMRPKSAETYETCSSGRSSTGGSDCCTSPDLLNCSSSVASSPRRPPQSSSLSHGRKRGGSAKDDTSPLDALFQMTSKTFEELNGESQEGQGSHMNMFSNRQQPKKKRKSRTAFTNHQIFELEKRFLYQKYLSPADRDEIAAQLGLSNAQVITWFQNRRAKLKRDMEELKKDVETAKVFVTQKSFLESVHSFSMLKKKSIAMDDEKSTTDK